MNYLIKPTSMSTGIAYGSCTYNCTSANSCGFCAYDSCSSKDVCYAKAHCNANALPYVISTDN